MGHCCFCVFVCVVCLFFVVTNQTNKKPTKHTTKKHTNKKQKQNKRQKPKQNRSDFPYFRIKNPENYIGILVDKKKFPNWELKIEGDEVNIPKLISNINHIDIFHYDSDKTYEGKINVYNLIKKKISIQQKIL